MTIISACGAGAKKRNRMHYIYAIAPYKLLQLHSICFKTKQYIIVGDLFDAACFRRMKILVEYIDVYTYIYIIYTNNSMLKPSKLLVDPV